MSDEANGAVGVREMAIARRKLGICRRCPTKLDPRDLGHLCSVCKGKAKQRTAERSAGPSTFESWERSERKRGRR